MVSVTHPLRSIIITIGTWSEIKRRELELDPQVCPEEIMSREMELGCELDFFRFGLFLNSSATDIVLVTLPCTSVETAIA